MKTKPSRKPKKSIRTKKSEKPMQESRTAAQAEAPPAIPNESGFSLLELLIVVAIILIISAIAIPKLLQARAAAAESAGAGVTRSMITALAGFNIRYNTFPSDPKFLGGTCNATTPPTATSACLMDDALVNALATTPIGQYTFSYSQTGSGAGFTLNADPITGSNATRHFYTDEGLTIRYSDSGAATVASSRL